MKLTLDLTPTMAEALEKLTAEFQSDLPGVMINMELVASTLLIAKLHEHGMLKSITDAYK